MKKSLTAPFVDSVLSPTDRAQLDVWDTRLPGFGLRVSRSGRKTWIAMYRHAGRKRRFSIGTYPPLSLADARERAKTILADAVKGSDPATAKQRDRDGEVFAELAALYVERHAKRKRTVHEDERIIRRELLPAWRNIRVGEIRRNDVIALLDRIVDRGAPIMANRTRALISKMFNFAIDRVLTEANPAAGVRNPGGEEEKRDRVLSSEEIRALWLALDAETPKIAALFRLLLLTAQRKGEVAGMRWGEIDFESAWWTIPKERSKNGLSHRVPLAPTAISILRGLYKDGVVGPVFPGSMGGQPLNNIAKPLRRLIKGSQVQFRIHDLRRTAATCMTSHGIPRLTVAKLLNHVERDITSTYDRASYDVEKRNALSRWEAVMAAILSGKPAKIVPFHAV